MKISFVQIYEKTGNSNGYGYAREMCENSLRNLGHDVVFLDRSADVEINFIQPDNARWSGCDYRIMFTPWESTQLPPGWVTLMNEVDEVWTPSPLIAQWYVESGVTKPVKVYQHGVESLWKPCLRSIEGRFNVLHHGAEALRKGGNETIRAFQSTLWDEEATLFLKMVLKQFNVHDTEHIIIRGKKIPIGELVELYHQSHLMVYPSWGEGFGLVPLQAMATGMPVLITKGWAPYERFLPDHCLIDSELVESPWQNIHPGNMFKPDEDDLRDKLRWHFDNREESRDYAYQIADSVTKEYDWDRLTERAFSHLI